MESKLKPCPCCGLQSHQDWDDTMYPSGLGWIEHEDSFREYLGYDEREDWQGMCYRIICAETYGGCGVSITGDSKEDVIDKWNRRVE